MIFTDKRAVLICFDDFMLLFAVFVGQVQSEAKKNRGDTFV